MPRRLGSPRSRHSALVHAQLHPVVIDVERPVQYEHHLLPENKEQKRPRRLYLDLKNTHVPTDIDSAIPFRMGCSREPGRAVHQGHGSGGLDINNIEGFKVFPLHDPFRIVIDVRGAEVKEKQKEKGKVKEPEPEKEKR